MKQKYTTVFSIFVLTHVLILCLLPISAQDYTQQHLPAGAKMRLGKSPISRGKHAVQFSPDGTRLAVATFIGIWIYETQTYQVVALFPEADNWPNSLNLSFSPDGRTLASEGQGKIHLWDVSTGTRRKTLADDNQSYRSMSFSPDGQTLASESGGYIHLWDVSTGALRKTLEDDGPTYGYYSISFSPDGRTLACGGQGKIDLWDVSAGTHREIPVSGTVNSVSFSPDGRTLVSSDDKGIYLWDVSTATRRKTFKNESDAYGPLSVDFSPDGQTLVSARVNAIHLWDVSTGTLRKISVGSTSVSFSADGQTLASTGNGVHLWDISTRTLHKTLTGYDEEILKEFSPDGRTLASVSSGHIHLWDVATGTLRKTLTGHTEIKNWVYGVSFSPDGSMLASGGDEGIHLWDVATGTLRKTFTKDGLAATTVRFSPDGLILASILVPASEEAAESEDEIHLWDVATGTRSKTLRSRHGQVSILRFSPDGSTLATLDDHGIQLWDVATGTLRSILGWWEDYPYHRIVSIAFSPDGRMLAGGGYKDTRFSDLPDFNSGYTDDADDESCTSIDPRGEGIVGLWDVATETRRILDTRPYLDVSFSPNGRMLASAGRDGIQLWDVSTSIRLKTLAAFANRVAFSPDGRTLASGGPDGTLLLWDLTRITGVFPKLTPLTQEALTIPTETTLLQNYPNPFNPETWIPYQLAEPAHVSLRIYAVNGALIRTLFSCADHEAGTYKSPDRAAYWDGKNDIGEPVANGLYFYTLTAGKFTLTRKMIIRR